MNYASIWAILVVLHAALYSVVEKFSAFTMVYAALWSFIAISIYAIGLSICGKSVLSAGASSLVIATLYFSFYKLIVYPPFIELKLFGFNLIKGGVMTDLGLLYLVAYSIAEGLLLFAAVFASGYLRNLVTR